MTVVFITFVNSLEKLLWTCLFWVPTRGQVTIYLNLPLADPEGGLRGLQPPLIFKKKVVIRVAVVIYLVVTSSKNVCLCALNGVVIGYYVRQNIGIAIVHYYFVLPGGAT